MRGKRFALGIGFALLFGVSIAHASSIAPGGIFNVDLDNPDSTTGGWFQQDGQDDGFTDVANPPIPGDISGTSFTCDEFKTWFWWWWWDHDKSDCYKDPDITIRGGGDAMDFPQTGFTATDGGGIFDFVNDSGTTLNSISFITELDPDLSYTCDPGLFTSCGFAVVPDSDPELEVYFYNSVPEPLEYPVLVVAGAGIALARRLRSRRMSA